jgi:hypothetical protein
MLARLPATRAVAAALLGLGLAALGCNAVPPTILSPAPGSSAALDGTVPVEIALASELPPGGRLLVTVLRGLDTGNVSSRDVSERVLVVGTQATATLDAADLSPGRNALYAGTDADGDGQPDDLASVEFRWDPLRAAVCKRMITPVAGVNHTSPIYMAGFDNDRQATGVHDELWARGFVLQNASRKIAIVTLDLIGYFNNEVQTIRANPALAALGLDAVMVTSTHEHEGPDTMGLWGPDQTTSGVDLGYLDFVNDQVVQCILEADAALAPAAMRFATGSTVGTSLPPHPDLVADGHVLQPYVIPGNLFNPPLAEPYVVEGDAGEIVNPSVPALQIRDALSEATIATVVNYASHPESLGSDNTLITSDFPHFMREALEARYGGTAIYVSADLGVLQGPLDVDVTDPLTSQPATRRTFRFAEVMGQLLADRAAAALDAVPSWDRNPALDVAGSGPILVEIQNTFFKVLAGYGVFGRRIPVTIDGRQYVESEVNAIRIGPAQLAVTPNELDPQIGDRYRDRMSQASHRWVLGLGNDEIGYQMPQEKYNPSCVECALYILVDNLAACPIYAELGPDAVDCSTVFQNNVGPDADPLLTGELEAAIGEINAPEPGGAAAGLACAGAILALAHRARARTRDA